MKTGAEKVLEWMNKFYSQNGTPNFGEIVAQLEMAIDEEKLNRSIPGNELPSTSYSSEKRLLVPYSLYPQSSEKPVVEITETEILDKLKTFLDLVILVRDAFPELLEKYDATDIKSGFADKLDTIPDPYERLLVGIHVTDQLNLFEISDELESLNLRHRHLLEVALYMNVGDVEKAKVSLRKYLKNFK